MVSDGVNSYKWDAENRLIEIDYPGSGNSSTFVCDGSGRNVKIVEVRGGSTTTTQQFVWCFDNRCEERNASNTITAQFFGLGETISGTSYFYSVDHLGLTAASTKLLMQNSEGFSIVFNPIACSGSTREMTDNSAIMQAQYSYSPFGRTTLLQGSMRADFQYAAYYEHAPSGLNLTMTRPYDNSLSRWISRDPLIEASNPYQYVENSPMSLTDGTGLAPGGFVIRIPIPGSHKTYDMNFCCKNQWNQIYNVTGAAVHYLPGIMLIAPFDYYAWNSIHEAAGELKDMPNPPCPNIPFFLYWPWLAPVYKLRMA